MRSRAIRMGVLAAMSSCFLSCGGDDDSTSNGNDLGDCEAVEACGGNPVGDWTVDEVCVSDPKKLFAALVGDQACASSLTDVGDITGSGNYNLRDDMMAVSTLVVAATAEFAFTDACVKAIGIANSAASECAKIQTELTSDPSSGVKSATCAASGSTCNCTIASEVSLAGDGSYTVSGNNISIRNLTQPFCVSGNNLELQTTTMGVTSTLKLHK